MRHEFGIALAGPQFPKSSVDGFFNNYMQYSQVIEINHVMLNFTVLEGEKDRSSAYPTKVALTTAIPVRSWGWRWARVHIDNTSILIMYLAVEVTTMEVVGTQKVPMLAKARQGSQWWWSQTENQRAVSVSSSSWWQELWGSITLAIMWRRVRSVWWKCASREVS